jgi:superfamily II DNA or RNA helicase
MSVRLLRSSLSEEQVATIRQMLILYPQTAPTYIKNNFYSTTEEKEPIVFYLIRKDSAGIEWVWLPFSFGNIIAGKIVNLERTYPVHDFEFKSTLYENQIPVVQEALAHLNTYCTANLFLSTGFGKSRCAVFTSSRIKLLTMVILHLSTLIDQWVKEFTDNTTAKIWVVDIANKIQIPKEFDVIICMNTRVINIPENILDQVGLTILDEVDRQLSKTKVLPFLSTAPKFMISLTATNDLRADGLDSMNQVMTGVHSVKREIIKNITLFKVNTGINPPVETGSKGINWSSLMRNLSRNEDRNNMIIQLALQNYHIKTLIMTEFQEHCELLYNKLKVLGKSVDYMTGNKKSYQNCQILVGSQKKCAVGFDDLNTATDSDGIRIQLLILTKTIKDESLLTQCMGRIRDPNPIIFYMIDEQSTIKRHFGVCKKWLKNRGLGIIDWTKPLEKLIVDKTGKIIDKAPEIEIVKVETKEMEIAKPKLKLVPN